MGRELSLISPFGVGRRKRRRTSALLAHTGWCLTHRSVRTALCGSRCMMIGTLDGYKLGGNGGSRDCMRALRASALVVGIKAIRRNGGCVFTHHHRRLLDCEDMIGVQLTREVPFHPSRTCYCLWARCWSACLGPPLCACALWRDALTRTSRTARRRA